MRGRACDKSVSQERGRLSICLKLRQILACFRWLFLYLICPSRRTVKGGEPRPVERTRISVPENGISSRTLSNRGQSSPIAGMWWRLGPVILPLLHLLPPRLLERQNTRLRNGWASLLDLGRVLGLAWRPAGGRRWLRGAVLILVPPGVGTTHAIGHNSEEFRADNWSAFLAWVERLGNLPIQKEELIITTSVEGDNSEM